MSLVWDAPVFTSDSGSIERVTVRYYFADETGRTRSVALVVWPDLSVRMNRPSGFGAPRDGAGVAPDTGYRPQAEPLDSLRRPPYS